MAKSFTLQTLCHAPPGADRQQQEDRQEENVWKVAFYDELAWINRAQDVAMKNDTLEKVKKATQASEE